MNYSSIQSPYNDYLERNSSSGDYIADPFNYNVKGGIADHSVVNNTMPNIDENQVSPVQYLTLEQLIKGDQVVFSPDNLGEGVISGFHLADLVVKNFIQSSLYVPGKSGFKLWGDSGDAEFNDVIIRGDILGRKTNYSDDTAGYFFGKDTDGLYKFYVGDVTNNIKWTGTSLSVTGTMNATSGSIGGWTINSTHIFSGATETTAGVSLDSVTPKIRVGPASAAERTEMRDGGIFGYGVNGSSVVWQFLNEPIKNNIMQLNKFDSTPAYGNGFKISDTSTDTDASFEIAGSGAGNATSKTLFLLVSNFTNATNIATIRCESGSKDYLLGMHNEAGAVNSCLYVRNDYAGGDSAYFWQTNASNTDPALSILHAGTGTPVYIDKDNDGYAVDIEQDANTANQAVGIRFAINNAGAGGEYAFEFAGGEFDATAGGNTRVGRIKVLIGGTLRYMYYYSN